MRPFPSKLVELVVTQKCNMNCTYCFEANKNSKDISPSIINDMKDVFYRDIRYIGGEPLLNPKAIEQLHSALPPTVNESITTNGTLIKDNIELLKKINARVMVSLDGFENENDMDRVYPNGAGTISDAMRGINLLEKNNIPFEIAITLGRNKLAHIYNIFRFVWETRLAKSNGNVDLAIDNMENSINIVTDMDISDEDINAFIDQQQKVKNYIFHLDLTEEQKSRLCINWFKNAVEPEWGCKASVGKMAVGNNGQIYPCLGVALSSGPLDYSEHKIHNLFIHYNNQKTVLSSTISKSSDDVKYWDKECPAHNSGIGNSMYYQNCKYNVLVAEYNRFVDDMDGFTRKHTIRDLFDATSIMSEFSLIGFETVSSLIKFRHSPFFNKISNADVEVRSHEELEDILREDFGDTVITIKYGDELKESILKMPPRKNIELSSCPETIKTLFGIHSLSIDSMLHWTQYTLSADNYEAVCEQMIRMAIKDPRFSWIDLRIDYASFEDSPMSELHKLYFYLNQIRIWKNECLPGTDYNIMLRGKPNAARCWMDDDLSVHFGDDVFPLASYTDKNGNQLDVTELNKIRQVVDMRFPSTKVKNQYFIDISQNKKIMGDYYRIPYLTELFCEWMGE